MPDKRSVIATGTALDLHFLEREQKRISKHKPCDIFHNGSHYILHYTTGYYVSDWSHRTKQELKWVTTK